MYLNSDLLTFSVAQNSFRMVIVSDVKKRGEWKECKKLESKSCYANKLITFDSIEKIISDVEVIQQEKVLKIIRLNFRHDHHGDEENKKQEMELLIALMEKSLWFPLNRFVLFYST
jgi:hypothetical protein